MANTYQSINMDAVGGSSQPPYQESFLSGSWVLNVDIYEIVIPKATHDKGTIISVQVFEKVVNDYIEVGTTVIVDTAGNLTLQVSTVPDLRFEGRVVIVGE